MKLRLYFRNRDFDFIKKIQNFPYHIIIAITMIVSFGITILYSAAGGSMYPWAIKQMIYFCIAFGIMLTISFIKIEYLYRYAYLFYFLSLCMIIFVHIYGHTAMGATRWINLGFMKLQPSEIMKIAVVFALARSFHNINSEDIKRLEFLIIPIMIIMLPFLIILKQPDLGTAMIILLLGGFMLFIAGVSYWVFITAGTIVAGLGPIIWNLLHDYQKNRILIFLNPELDPRGAGYNITQSKIAIGSGGMWGKGLLQGTQSQLDFLPEHQTDFIFTMLLEETGFIGGVLLILTYIFIIISSIIIATNAVNHFLRLLAIGSCIIFFLHIFINTAMVMGLIPVVGVPLPFLTYGGTMMVTSMMCFGIIVNTYLNSNNQLKKHYERGLFFR